MQNQDFEKLGVFYLGRRYDGSAQPPLGEMVLYDSQDLVTHAVCVGMTGSGKTGLCLALLEEAAIDGIPALVIDPKGDLANLLLTFPELRAEDFRPWINEADAARRGVSPDEFADSEADKWRRGLAEWGQDGARIGRLRGAAAFTVFTPGSTAGQPLSMLKQFAAPPKALCADAEALAELIGTTASGLLALAGIEADPIQSRDHILLSTLLGAAWRAGHDLDLPTIIAQVQDPPVKKIGVLDVESFYPAKERFALAMRLNNLLAAPGFSAWLQGEPLDVERLLHTPGGKPRISIFSIAHLDDAERMFFVATLLEQVVGWMRTQPGTTSLRAIVYMDEIFGFFPPVAEPPSKRPLLTLLKQARAYGVGVVLATQNPVDLDYKGLSNAGTWFVGRLQTERDQARLLDGLEGAAGATGTAFDRGEIQRLLAGLQNRVFLMNNVHEAAPVLFQVRWAMSYLRGPMTREQIHRLLDNGSSPAAENPAAAAASAPRAPARFDMAAARARPVLEPDVPQYFLPACEVPPGGAQLVYRPQLLGIVNVHYLQAKTAVDVSDEFALLVDVQPEGTTVDWQFSAVTTVRRGDLQTAPAAGAAYAPLASAACQAKSYKAWHKGLVDYIYRTRRLTLWRSVALKLISKPGESKGDFRVRVTQKAHEWRDAEKSKLSESYVAKRAALQLQWEKADARVDAARSESTRKRAESAVGFFGAIAELLLGRKRISATSVRRAGTATRSAGRMLGSSKTVEDAEHNREAIDRQLEQLDRDFQADVDAVGTKAAAMLESLEALPIAPKKSEITVGLLALAWQPEHVVAAAVAPPTTEPNGSA